MTDGMSGLVGLGADGAGIIAATRKVCENDETLSIYIATAKVYYRLSSDAR
jgi:hypothetical protein